MASGPRLSIGQALTASTCQRFAARTLDPDRQKPRTSDGAFRLMNAITVAIVDSHREFHDADQPAGGLSRALESKLPPPELGHEEAARFRTALDAYEDAFGSDGHARAVLLHAKADSPLTIPIGDCGIALTGSVKLAFSNEPGSPHSGSITIRSITVGPLGNGEADPRPDALRFAALGASEGVAQRLVVSPSGVVSSSIREFTREEIKATWRELGDVLDAALSAGESAPPTPGWWCTNCSFVRGCSAVSEGRFVDFLASYPASDETTGDGATFR